MKRLNRKKALNLVKKLDVFPKVPESYVETSAIGGTVSLIVFLSMALLTLLEFFVYQDTWMKYEYEVDKDFSSKLRINIDITVAMECQFIGADVLDRADVMVSLNDLKYEPVSFELSPQQRHWYQTIFQHQNRLKTEHSLQHVLKLKESLFPPVFLREPSEPPNACRIYGRVYVNKVDGNLHFTLGKAFHQFGAHAHFALLIKNDVQNFSHRIDHLSFGDDAPGHINPLDTIEKITFENNQLFQYFVIIVPTKLQTSEYSLDMHQYSVTEQERVVDLEKDDHGVPGIFVKYSLNPLMVRVSEEHMPLGTFLVRLCGIIGGIFSTSNLLHRLVGFLFDIACCHFRPKQVLPQSKDDVVRK